MTVEHSELAQMINLMLPSQRLITMFVLALGIDIFIPSCDIQFLSCVRGMRDAVLRFLLIRIPPTDPLTH